MANGGSGPRMRRLAFGVGVSVSLMIGVVAASAASSSPSVACNNLDAVSCDAAWREMVAIATLNEPALARLEVTRVEVRDGPCGLEGFMEWSEGRAAVYESFC